MLPKVTQVTQLKLGKTRSFDPPGLVIDAFNDVQRAKADKERVRNEAASYANNILPRAREEYRALRRKLKPATTGASHFGRSKAGRG